MIVKNFSMILLFTIASSFAFSPETDPLPNTLNYRLDMRIDYSAEKLYGLCEMTISNGSKRSIEQVPILLYRLLTVKSVRDQNKAPLSYSQNVVSIAGWEEVQVNYVNISLSKRLSPGESYKLIMEYDGYLLGYAEAGWRYVKEHIDRNFTMIRTDGFGYPVVGYPNDRDMMAIAKERYDYTISINVPDEMIAVSGGELINRSKKGDGTTWEFRSKKPSFRLDVAISDYDIFEKGVNKVCYFAGDSLGAHRILNALQTALTLYTGWFGPLDNYQGFTVIEVPDGYGSQQDVAAVILTADNFREAKQMQTIYHEMAHSWNVKHLDLPPCRFESEGFAQFMQFLLLEKLDNAENAVSQAAQRYLDRVRNDFNEQKEYQSIPIKDYGIRDMTDYSYTLGMVVFALFYDLVGQDIFNEIIGSFYTANHLRGATLDEFINHCIKLANRDVEKFFNDWIYSTKGIELVVAGKTFEELLRYYKEK